MLNQDESTRKKQINSIRFNWHESVIADPVANKRPAALALAGYIMHRFKAETGTAEFSTKGAAKALNYPVRSIARAKEFLIKRGWISLKEEYKPTRVRWTANRYILTGGPDDLLFDHPE